MNDDNFKINLKKEEFQIIYKNINEIFNGNFASFVSYSKYYLFYLRFLFYQKLPILFYLIKYS